MARRNYVLFDYVHDPSMSNHYCYILFNKSNNATYNGYTVNLERRLRQHNGIIQGGAKYTTRLITKIKPSEWRYLAVIHSPIFTSKTALSLEWSIKYPTHKRPRPALFNSPHGRIQGLKHALLQPKFSEWISPSTPITLYVNDEFIEYTKTIMSEIINSEMVKVHSLCSLDNS